MGLMGKGNVASIAIGGGIDSDRVYSQGPRRPDDAAGNLAPIGNQQAPEHDIQE